MLNRAALIVRPKQPFIDWAKSLDDTNSAPDPQNEQTVYLVDDFNHDLDKRANEAAVVESVYAEVFARELFLWHTIESRWPTDRSLSAFKSWFTIEIHSSVEDLGDQPITDVE
jgi:hypothetical protein